MASSTEVLHDLTVDSDIRGYHVYKDIWVPILIGEILFCEQELREPGNEEDRFAVAGYQLSKYLGTFELENLACSPNFRANNNQFPQGCRIIRVLKISGTYGSHYFKKPISYRDIAGR